MLKFYRNMMEVNTIYNMDCLEGLKTLPDNSIDCCVTSPPYYRRHITDCGITKPQRGMEVTSIVTIP